MGRSFVKSFTWANAWFGLFPSVEADVESQRALTCNLQFKRQCATQNHDRDPCGVPKLRRLESHSTQSSCANAQQAVGCVIASSLRLLFVVFLIST